MRTLLPFGDDPAPEQAPQARSLPLSMDSSSLSPSSLTRPITVIRSFVHRRSRITPAQHRARERLSKFWSIPYGPQLLDLTEAFGRQAPTILEIGFGMGETTAEIARRHPEQNFLGVEVFDAGVGALLKRIEAAQLENLRIIQHDAVEVVRSMLAPEMLAGIHIYFPDPWPKKRHHKRRLIQPPFIALLASRLAPGGYLHCATDWEPYAAQMLDVLRAEPLLRNTTLDYTLRPAFRPQTKFEIRGLKLGHGVWDLMFTRVGA